MAIDQQTSAAPSGDVTLMFTDIEGSTKGWDTYRDVYHVALNAHNELMRASIAKYAGYEVKTIGDSFMVAFRSPLQAALCALDMQQAIEGHTFGEIGSLRVRIGLHSGLIQPVHGDYFGPTVNHAARIESSAHGGQVVLSEETANAIREALPAYATLSDEGLHRLKDLGAPIRLFLLGHTALPRREYPPLRTLNMLPHNFPAQVTSFIGREREQKDLVALIVDQKARIVTLTGPGGTGKTRLSMQVAAEAVQEFKDGIWLVELASLSDAREVPAAVALALRIPIVGDTGIPAQIFDNLKEKTALLVFDNFEQVVDAARFVGDLLKQCRRISCMVTSQHLLQIAGEVEYPLAPLTLPAKGASLEECFSNPTVQLFAERAQSAKPAFELTDDNITDVVEICRRLEGLPLAIELTAALVRAMTPQQILPRLHDRYKLLASSRRDLDPRQRSLRGALDWSYELLNEEERDFFAQISVFSGGFFLDDVEAICTDSDGFFMAVALRDKSLLKTEEVLDQTRYLFLETLRGYAAEKLELTDRADEIRERHALHFLERANQWSADLNSSGEAMLRMIRDIDNLRAGMDWSIAHGRDDLVAAYGAAMGRFFLHRGLYEEGERRLATADASARCLDDTGLLAQMLLLRGRIAIQSARHEDARAHYNASYVLSERLGDKPRMVMLLNNLGVVSQREADWSAAEVSWRQGLELARETGNVAYEASLLSNLGTLSGSLGRYDEAIDFIEQGLALHRRNRNQRGLAYALLNYADTLSRQDVLVKALDHLTEAIRIMEELGDRYGIAHAVVQSGNLKHKLGDDSGAMEMADKGIQLAEDLNDDDIRILSFSLRASALRHRGDLCLARQDAINAASLALDRTARPHMITIIKLLNTHILSEPSQNNTNVVDRALEMANSGDWEQVTHVLADLRNQAQEIQRQDCTH